MRALGDAPASREDLRLDYQEVNANLRWLGEVRFKLLAFLPTVSGVAVGLLTTDEGIEPASGFAISVLGFVATAGVLIYDVRNSQIYYALGERAKFLERKLGHPSSGFRADRSGQFGERPPPFRARRRTAITHGLGLAVIYASVLGLWAFAASRFAFLAAGAVEDVGSWAAAIGALVGLSALAGLLEIQNRMLSGAASKTREKEDGPGS